MPCRVGTAVAQFQRLQCLAPSDACRAQSPHRFAGLVEEDLVVIDLAGGDEAITEIDVSLQNV